MSCPALHIIAGAMGTTDTGEPITARHVTAPRWLGGHLVDQCVHCRSIVNPGPDVIAQADLRD
ncbi:MAG: hypothetical protein L0G99_09170 [Propionibacteriales bacterium]|nr:hypothetical protein [Propionibacteriales bacterium]